MLTAERKRSTRWPYPVGSGGVVAAAFVLMLLSCGGGRRGPRESVRAIPIKVQTAARVEQRVAVAVSGSVVSREMVRAGFKVAGRVADVGYFEGDRVARGAVIAKLDDTDYRLATAAAEAKLHRARTVLAKAEAGARPQELERARIAYEQKKDEYGRLRQLYEKGSLAPVDFKKIEAAYLAAKQEFDMVREGARPEDKEAARAVVAEAEAGLALARDRLEATELTSTLSGLVARRHTEPGQMIAAGSPVLTILQVDPAEVRVGVPESDVSLVRPSQTAMVRVPALGNREFQGRVRLVGAAADPASRTYSVRITVPNPELVLRAGMITEVRIETEKTRDVVLIPGSAVVRDPNGVIQVFVYLPDQRCAYARRVEVGAPDGERVEILQGLKDGELVVVAGQTRLRDGSAVELAGASPGEVSR